MSQSMLVRLWTASGLRGALIRSATTTTSSQQQQQVAEATLKKERPVTDIPGPLAFPLIGCLPSMLVDKKFNWKKLHIYWSSLIDQYGSIVRLEVAGSPPFVVLSSPEDCERLNRLTVEQPQRPPMQSLKYLRDNWNNNYFEKRGGLLVENGKEWWRVRSRVQTTLLKPMVVSEYVAEMDDIALTFMERIQELQDKYGEMPENFQEELYKWALESVGVVALDRRFGCLGAPAGSVEAKRGEYLINVVNDIFASLFITEVKAPLWRLFSTPSYRRLRDNHAKLLSVVEEHVASKVAALEQRKDEEKKARDRTTSVIEKLLSTPGLGRKDILTFIMDLVFAGIDTTSHTIGFCLYLLARNPEAQRKLQQEVDQVTAGLQETLTSHHLARLSYTKAVIKETLRIFPLVIALARILKDDVVMQGYKIPAGHFVMALNYVMSQNPSVFPRPDEFLPERWLRERSLGYIHPFAALPFGAGPRMCVGRRVAEQEMYTLLARIAQRYTVEYHHEDIEMLSGLIMYPSRPLKFSFVPR